jgi:hypothetical protein
MNNSKKAMFLYNEYKKCGLLSFPYWVTKKRHHCVVPGTWSYFSPESTHWEYWYSSQFVHFIMEMTRAALLSLWFCVWCPAMQACCPGFDPTTSFYSLKILTVSQSNYHAEAIFSATGIEMHAFSCSAYFPSDPYRERLLLRRMGGLLQRRKGIFVIIFSY